MRRLMLLIIAVAGVTAVAHSQSFEVVTIKKAEAPRPPFALGCRGVDAGPPVIPQGRCRYPAVTLKMLLMQAYQVKENELDRADGWMSSDLYAIEGIAADIATAKYEDLRAMLRRQIEESFELKFHRETRTVTGYVLTVADQNKLVPVAADEKLPVSFRFARVATGNQITAYRGPLANFPRMLSRILNAPVTDGMVLTGRYKLDLDLGHDITDSFGAESALIAVLPEKGLRLKSEKTQIEVMVIDSAERIP
jgi:uncharacterized protein (TIGR03435 family)